MNGKQRLWVSLTIWGAIPVLFVTIIGCIVLWNDRTQIVVGTLCFLAAWVLGVSLFMAARGLLHLHAHKLKNDDLLLDLILKKEQAVQLRVNTQLRLRDLDLLYADEQGNYPIHLRPSSIEMDPMIFAPGNSPHAALGRNRVSEPEAPRLTTRPPTFAELLASHSIVPYEEESILGYSDGEARRGDWSKLHSFMVFGMSGSGKSSTVSYYVALSILHGARLLVIDPEAEEEESLTNRLAPLLTFALITPVGDTPAGAKRVIDCAKRELEKPGDYPVVFCVDEFSSIMRKGEQGEKGWGELATSLASIVEDYGQRGRKRQRTAIVIGQIGNASRTGGTEVKHSMTATFIHRLPVQQARLLIDNNTAKLCPKLEQGEVVVMLSNSPEPYRMNIPFATIEDMKQVSRLMHQSEPVQEPKFTDSKLTRFPGSAPLLELPTHIVSTTPEPIEPALQARIDRIKQLREAGVMNQGQIIEEVYGAKKGGSVAYQSAVVEYRQIIEYLTEREEA